MLFQQPVVFPGSILDNALFGLRHATRVPRREHRQRAEEALRGVGLWPEVADRLGETAAVLSVGQQQRLCLARALALEPEVLLMDEPTSALDPRSTTTIERLVQGLAGTTTVVIVTHDPGQARRVAHRAACLAPDEDGAGRIVGCDACESLFRQPGLMDLFGGSERHLPEDQPR
jgi:phosphate transport system ATP-binding protein